MNGKSESETPEVDAVVHNGFSLARVARSLERRLAAALLDVEGHKAGEGCQHQRAEESERREALAQTEIKGHMRIEDDLKVRIAELEKDAARVDWVERYLCRAGEVKDDAGQTVKLCRVWSIMGELETFRETVDAHIAALKDRA